MTITEARQVIEFIENSELFKSDLVKYELKLTNHVDLKVILWCDKSKSFSYVKEFAILDDGLINGVAAIIRSNHIILEQAEMHIF